MSQKGTCSSVQSIENMQILYYRFIYKTGRWCYIRHRNQGTPKKGNEEMFFANIMFSHHQDYYELSQRSFLYELRDRLVRPYKAKFNDFHIISP